MEQRAIHNLAPADFSKLLLLHSPSATILQLHAFFLGLKHVNSLFQGTCTVGLEWLSPRSLHDCLVFITQVQTQKVTLSEMPFLTTLIELPHLQLIIILFYFPPCT